MEHFFYLIIEIRQEKERIVVSMEQIQIKYGTLTRSTILNEKSTEQLLPSLMKYSKSLVPIKETNFSFQSQFEYRQNNNQNSKVTQQQRQAMLETLKLCLIRVFERLKNPIFLQIVYFPPFAQCFLHQLALAETNFTNIKILNLISNNLTHKSMKILTACEFINLQWLSVQNNPIKNKGLSYISKAKWPPLKYLNLSNISITQDGLKDLIRHSKNQKYFITLEQTIKNINILRELLLAPSIRNITINKITRNIDFNQTNQKLLIFINEAAKLKQISYWSFKFKIPQTLLLQVFERKITMKN